MLRQALLHQRSVQMRMPVMFQAMQARAFSEKDPYNKYRPKRRSIFGQPPKQTEEPAKEVKPAEPVKAKEERKPIAEKR